LISNQKDFKIIPFWGNIYFQNRNSPLMEHLIFFHDHAIIIIFLIVIWVFQIMYTSVKRLFFNRFMSECQDLEIFWRILPSFVLLFLSFPSIKILYITEEFMNSIFSVKVIGHQWYWRYEYSDFLESEFDSFLEERTLIRLLDTSHYLTILIKCSSRILISSEDVIHSWTIPSLGVKVDAVPGRINQVILHPNRVGIFTGQCREICGANHSFIPITVSVVNFLNFK